MNPVKRAGFGLALLALWAGSATPILAADNGTVEASVSVAAPCLIVSPGQVDFGTLPFSTVSGVSAGFENLSYANCSTAAEVVFGRGTDATGNSGGTPISWALEPTLNGCGGIGVNQYNLSVRIPGSPNFALAATDAAIETVQPGNSGAANSLALVMPCSGSDGIGTLMSFQAIFTATF